MNQNNLEKNPQGLVMFVDMNSFFASCEQQVNYWLRGRPVGVCVYTGKSGCIIAPSIEAKKRGIKLGLRLSEAMQICPDLVPLETHPARYREFHQKMVKVLRKYCDDVIPKSIDEAVMNLTDYKLIYKDPTKLAYQIKADIKKEVGDWLKCSIGIAPNAFLSKLATDLQKPDGLVKIMPDNIDEVLSKLQLTDLPGIADAMALRLRRYGIRTPLELRYTPPEKIRAACHSIIGEHWYYRLNFSEVDLWTHNYKSMQAMRQISKAQRLSLQTLEELFVALCMTLERRMVLQRVFCNEIYFTASYENGYRWADKIKTGRPIQDGTELMQLIKLRMRKFQEVQHCEPVINLNMTAMGVTVTAFIPDEMVQIEIFESNLRKNTLRRVVYDIKEKFGFEKVMKASELNEEHVLKDVIGFGSIKDLHEDIR